MAGQSNPLLNAALLYAERGWPVFPARADKTPWTAHGVLDATTDPEQIRTWWAEHPTANVALDVGGAGMMVLDLDPGHDMKELEDNVGLLPDTRLHAKTPRGGEHLYFALGDGEVVAASASKLAQHVDVRSFHSYVLLPPSRTSAGVYTWEAEGKAAYRADEMVRLSNSATEKHPERERWLIDPDLPENVERATTWLLRDAKPAVEGEGGEACAYATAAMLLGYGVSEDRAYELMLEHWSPRCVPPWDDDLEYLRAKVANAYRYNTSPPGRLTPAYHAARTRDLFEVRHQEAVEGELTTVAGFRFADEAALRHVRPPEWVLVDWIPDEAYAMLFGPWGAFKTFLALDAALTVAGGAPAWPVQTLWEAPKPGPVLFAAGEGRSALARRVAAWKRHHGAEAIANFVLVDPVPLVGITEEYLTAFIAEALRRHPGGYRLGVIDTVGRSTAGENENDQRVASAFTNLMHRLRSELGGSMLGVHHSGHQEDHRARGSSVFGADPDTIVRAERWGPSLVKLTMAKQKDAPEWEEPRWAALRTVALEDGQTSLAVARPRPEELPRERDSGEIRDAALDESVDREIAAVLRDNPERRWTQGALAAAVAYQEAVDVPVKKLVGEFLPRLRNAPGTAARRCFDPLANQAGGQWRWRGES